MSAVTTADLRATGLLVAPGQEAVFAYRGGEHRRVRPIALWFGSTRWHATPQWLLRVVDLGRGAPKDFALAEVVPDGVADGAVDWRADGLLFAPGQAADVDYKNWRQEIDPCRRILPVALWLGSTDWHPEQQWFLKATDAARGVGRDFALPDAYPVGCRPA